MRGKVEQARFERWHSSRNAAKNASPGGSWQLTADSKKSGKGEVEIRNSKIEIGNSKFENGAFSR
jgi:hypothetical protein